MAKAKKSSKKSKRASPALAALQKLWSGGEPRKALGPLPDGTYQATITKAELKTTQTGKPQIDTTLQVISGEYEDRTVHKYDLLMTQENVNWVQGMFEVLEVELPEKVKDLPDVLEETVGKIVEISVRNAEGFCNVYINDLLEEVEDDEDVEEDEEDEDEEEFDEDEEESEEDEEEEVSEEEEEEESDEEEEEPAPKKKRKRRK